ncbi:heme/hemin ABC transporter substrate-binding protein [Arthrobacter woluwensis]|uniref:heme/hemin ABC transporter substrate-binding protein n=1 Tax=Arthrobacter woluwensis TaxID=156980 RepID=UPI0011A76300|nr:ABC transporter substrate-binding protein [Arthrobacter woluwensis]
MKTCKTFPTVALTAVVALLLSACSPGAATPAEQSAHPSSTHPTSASAAPGAVNALTLKGPAEAATVPDVTPAVRSPRPALPVTLRDASGRSVTVTSADRILALDLYGTLTDTVIGLGLEKHLVGRSNADTQKVLKELPVVTQGGHDLNTEAVLQLRPSLVLTNTTIGSEDKYRQLEFAGVTVVRFQQPQGLAGIGKTIDAVGHALGLSQAAHTLAQRTEADLATARARIAGLKAATPTAPRGAVLYIRGTAGVFFILGRDYGAADIIDTLGLKDVAAENGITQLKPANAEALVSLDPEIVLAMKDGVQSTGGVDGLVKRPGMAATTAGSTRRIITAADGQLLSYGPRTPANLIALAEAIYTAGAGSK